MRGLGDTVPQPQVDSLFAYMDKESSTWPYQNSHCVYFEAKTILNRHVGTYHAAELECDELVIRCDEYDEATVSEIRLESVTSVELQDELWAWYRWGSDEYGIPNWWEVDSAFYRETGYHLAMENEKQRWQTGRCCKG